MQKTKLKLLLLIVCTSLFGCDYFLDSGINQPSSVNVDHSSTTIVETPSTQEETTQDPGTTPTTQEDETTQTPTPSTPNPSTPNPSSPIPSSPIPSSPIPSSPIPSSPVPSTGGPTTPNTQPSTTPPVESTSPTTITPPTEEELIPYYDDLFVGNWKMPGIYNKDGTPHTTPQKLVLKKKVDLSTFSNIQANNPDFDNTDGFQNAVNSLNSGDYLFVPNGDYYFKGKGQGSSNAYYEHINFKSDNTAIIGESVDGVRLISDFGEEINETKSTTVILINNRKNIRIEKLTITSVEQNLPTDPTNDENTTFYKGPNAGISIDRTSANSDDSQNVSNIVVDNVKIERFRKYGIKLVRSRDVTITNSHFSNALSIGGSGHGYGISVQGNGANNDLTDTNQDTRHNIIEGNTFQGPYLRHGVLIQYYAHNNLVFNNEFNNTFRDAIDLHGEDEYSNLITNNVINNTRTGGGIGVGNTGATHDAAGANNMLVSNTINNCREGILIYQGSPNTIVIKNVINGVSGNSSTFAIKVDNGPGSRILGNVINDVDAYSIRVINSNDVKIVGNIISNCNTNKAIIVEGSTNVTKEQNFVDSVLSKKRKK